MMLKEIENVCEFYNKNDQSFLMFIKCYENNFSSIERFCVLLKKIVNEIYEKKYDEIIQNIEYRILTK
jgi:hypothetical protein